MAVVCGSVISITLKGRQFAVSADSDVQLDLGGYTNTIMPNGNGTARLQKLRGVWKASGINVAIDNSRADHEFIQDLKDELDFFPVALEFTDGTVYQGTGQITSETAQSVLNGTMPIELSGTGKATQQ
jgi:ABC-type protease/lipase transport system fused ATPase/permease subunit